MPGYFVADAAVIGLHISIACGLAEGVTHRKGAEAHAVDGVEVEVLIAEAGEEASSADGVRTVSENGAKVLEGNSDLTALRAQRDHADRGAGDRKLGQLGANRSVD